MAKTDPARFETLYDSMLKALQRKIDSGDATASDLSVARQLLNDAGFSVANDDAPTLGLVAALPDLPEDDDDEHPMAYTG